jgi:putative ABC transport system permease protein
MAWLSRMRHQWRALVSRRRLEREMDEELRLHVVMETEENVRRGLSPEEASREAQRQFGGLDQTKETARDGWWGRFLETLAQDARYGARGLRKSPVYTAVVVLTLGLGIGANTAIFSVVHGVLLRKLPYGAGDRLLVLRQQQQGADDLGFSPLEITDYRERSRTLESVVEYHNMWFTLLGRAEPERVRTGVVSAQFFDALGVRPILGRGFTALDETHEAPAVLLLSYEYWLRSFGEDKGVVGRTFEMNDRVHTVVGVLPPLPFYPDENDVFMPTTACPFRARPTTLENRQARLATAFAVVRPGTALGDVRADLVRVAKDLAKDHPDAYPQDSGFTTVSHLVRDELTRNARPSLLLLLATAGFVLLTVCANVANLTLARLTHRERELALRSALGAARGRILRQLLTESTVLALLGGAFGLLLAKLTLGMLVQFTARFTPRASEIGIDGPVLLFALAASLGTGLAFGALPGLSRREEVGASLRDGSRASSGRTPLRMRNVLVVSQLAVSFVLLIGAALMIRSLVKLEQVDPGFRPQNVLAMSFDLNWSRYKTPEQMLGFYEPLLQRVAELPGVLSVGGSFSVPLNQRPGGGSAIQVEGRAVDPRTAPRAQFQLATPSYFETVGVPVLRGRAFAASDTREAPAVAMINRTFARQSFASEDPVGRRLSFDGGRQWLTVIGVVGDVRQHSLDREAAPEIYLAFLQRPGLSTTLLVRTAGAPLTLARQITRVTHELDPAQAVADVRTLEQVRSDSLASPRLTTALLGLFAVLAMLVSAAGISGVIAFTVSQRTHEIGIRMALGARPATLLGMLFRQGMAPVLSGLLLGILGALALSRVMEGLLFGVSPTDAACFVGSAVVLFGVSAAACLIPARRATAIPPTVALRAE